MKIFQIILFCLAFKTLCFSQTAQDSSKINSKKNMLSFNIAGSSPLFGLNYERFITPKLCSEIGLGFFSIGIGIKYYPKKTLTKKFNPFLGFSTSIWNIPFADGFQNNYFPFGFSYFNKRSLYFSFDLGPNLLLMGSNWHEYVSKVKRGLNYQSDIHPIPYASICIGKRF